MNLFINRRRKKPLFTMTKRKIKEWEGSEWLSGQFPSPAAMSSSSGSVSSCDYCHGRFGYFWWTSGGRKSCQFCGYQIHSRCSSSLPNDNGRKTRICRRCLKYKYNSSKLLIEGNQRHFSLSHSLLTTPSLSAL